MSELYQLPDGWEWKKLGDLFTITSSKRVHKEDWLSSGVPFYRAREIVQLSKNGFVDNELFISEEMYGSFTAKFGYPLTDDILITSVGTLGVCYVVKDGDRFYFKDGNIIWLRKIVDITISRFIEYSFKTEHVRSQIYSNSGSTVATYTITNANNTNIPLPPLAEQKRIVQKLDALFERIDKAIALLQKNIDAANNLMNSVLDDVFSDLEQNDPIVKISDIAYIKGGKRLPKGEKLSETKTEYPYIRVADFLDIGTISLEKMLYITEDIHKQIKNYIITSSDLYISIAGTIGKTGIIPDILNGANLTENAARLVYKCSNVLNRYIYFLTNSMKFKEQIGLATKTVAQPKLALSRLSEVELPLPMLDIQHKVVSYLDSVSIQIEQVKSAQQQKMQNLLDLKSSILDQAFRGVL